MNKLKKAILSSAKLSAVFSKVLGTQKKVEIPETDEKYFKKLAADGFWTNTLETAVPIYQIYHHVHDFFDCCKITDEGAFHPICSSMRKRDFTPLWAFAGALISTRT